MGETFEQYRDRQRRVRAVAESVRAQRRGEPAAEIAAELTRRFTAAGLPQLPESVDQHAAGVISRPRALLAATVTGLRALARREAPAGFRIGRRELAGDTWTPVLLSDDPLARRSLRIHHDLLHDSGLGRLGHAGRLIPLPAGDVAVFLGSTFVGLLPPEPAAGLHPIATATDAADQRLMVRATTARAGETLTMAVALP